MIFQNCKSSFLNKKGAFNMHKNGDNILSLLNVEHLTHGFGDRAIFDDVSFRLLKSEHIGLVGANW